MSGKSKVPEPKQGAPAYIVTFSDMITLLLTFFVLLLSLADEQKEGMFQQGKNSFKRAVADFGMAGRMFSKNAGSQFSHPKIKYRIEKGEDSDEDRSIDSATEVYRRLLQDIEKMMKISPSQITCTEKTFTITDIKFEDGEWELDNADKQFLNEYINGVGASYANELPTLYVVGLAGMEKDAKQQWLVSAKRAQSVADHIRSLSEGQNKWPVYSWGTGTGGKWAGQTGVLSKESHIMIAVLTDE